MSGAEPAGGGSLARVVGGMTKSGTHLTEP